MSPIHRELCTDLEGFRTSDLVQALGESFVEGDYQLSVVQTMKRSWDSSGRCGFKYYDVDVKLIETELAARRIKEKADMHALFERTNTRLLLAWLASSRRCGGWYSPWDKNGPGFTTDDIKAALATRPHIPNKKEGRELRRKAATEGRRNKRRPI